MGSPDKRPLGQRLGLRARVKSILEVYPRLRAALFSDLLWGVVFTALIVLILLPLRPIQEEEYALDSIAPEIIIAPQDLLIPDFETTERRKRERVAAVRGAYVFDPAVGDRAVFQLERLFEIGWNEINARRLERFPDDPDSPEALARYDELLQALSEEEEFLLRLQAAIDEEVNLSVPAAVLGVLARQGFGDDLRYLVTEEILKPILQQPIADVGAEEPALLTASGSPLDPASLLSLQQARQRLSTLALASPEWMSREARSQIAGWLQTLVGPTATLDVERLNRDLAEARAVEMLYFRVRRGEVIARPGDRVSDPDTLAKINYIVSGRTGGLDYLLRAIGLCLFTAFLLYSMSKFGHFWRGRRKEMQHLFLLLVITLAINLTTVRLVMMIADSFSSYFTAPIFQNAGLYYWAAPFAAGTMVVALLIGSQIAAIYSIALVVLSAFLFNGNFSILLYALVGCFTVIYGLRHYRERTAVIKSGIALGLMNVIAILTIGLFGEQIGEPGGLTLGLATGFLGGLLTAFVASFVLPVMESLFQVTTDVKLLELSNHEHPLLREMFMRAPGTSQHSITIGYLAESAAAVIGANALFCRVACLYHDIGKMLKPDYYVENTLDLGNKHKNLKPNMSALIITSHVKNGIELGRRYRLPESIIDIIPQHHGTKLIRYFYEKAKRRQKPDLGPVAEDEFRYSGPKPQTREAGIIMIADGAEAAARSLDDPNPAHLKSTITTVIESTFLDGQLDECDLTLKDLTKISDAFLKVLSSLYHERLKYPGIELEKRTGRREAAKAKAAGAGAERAAADRARGGSPENEQ